MSTLAPPEPASDPSARLPLVPLLAIYAAAAMTRRESLIAARRSLGFTAATILCLVLTCGWIREFLVVDRGHFSG